MTKLSIPATGLVVLGLLAMACGESSSSRRSDSRGPNVIIVIADALRADHMSLYGHARRTTPHVERLARQGVVFERAFSQAPWTPPSMASLMTGFYQSTHRVTHSFSDQGRHSVLDPRFTTLAELFRSAGYRTGAVSAQPWVSKATGFEQGFQHFELVSGNNDPYSTDKAMVAALEWIGRVKHQPFFLYLHSIDPHEPYDVRELFSFEPESGRVPEVFADGIGKLGGWTVSGTRPTPEEMSYLLATYDGEIRYVDWWMGVLDRHLRFRGLREKTLIIFMSDHGEAFWEHGTHGHRNSVYNEMLHIPLVFSQPGLEPRREPRPVETVDILPTLARLVGFEVPEGAPGVDLLEGELPGLAYSEGNRLESFKIQNADMSLILSPAEKRVELYDLRADPGEQNDLGAEAGDGEVSDEARDLMRVLLRRRTRAEALAFEGAVEQTTLDDETLRELEALGYVD